MASKVSGDSDLLCLTGVPTDNVSVIWEKKSDVWTDKLKL
jgi:hypothetical protein